LQFEIDAFVEFTGIENQVPVLAPDDVAAINAELPEVSQLAVFIVLRLQMWV
jgi:hypothetical protein